MNTLQKVFTLEEKLIKFILENSEVSDTTLKKIFFENERACFEELMMGLYEIIDPLFFENKIERFYPPDSQVPFYRIC